MRGINPHNRRQSPLWMLGGLFFVLLFGAVATGATLWMAGVEFPFLASAKPPRVQIPVNARPIAPYASVTREDMIDPQKRAIATIELRPDQIVGIGLKYIGDDGQEVSSAAREVTEENGTFMISIDGGKRIPIGRVRELGGAMMSVNDIIGRVVSKEKNPGLAFTESSFLPKGTRPGLAGATPPGMQSMTLESSSIAGLHGLKLGDKVDLIASVPHDMLGEFDPSHKPRSGVQFVTRSKASDPPQAVVERTIAQSAILLTPVRIRQKPSTTSSLTEGQRVQNIPVEEVVLALTPSDIPHVKKALHKGLSVMAVAQSGQAAKGGSDDSEAPAEQKLAVAFPLVKRTIPAFQRITEQDFIDPVTRRPEFAYYDPDTATRSKLVPYDFLLGRVANRDIEAGTVISESELAEQGAKGGIGSVIPPDRQAVVISASQILGSEYLSVGDHLDLLGSFKLEHERKTELTILDDDNKMTITSSEAISRKTDLQWSDSLGHRAEHWLLAVDAQVVAIARTPNESSGANNSIANPISSLTLAVRLRDADALSQAAAMVEEIKITAAFRSNLPINAPLGMASVPLCTVAVRAFEKLEPWGAAVARPALTSLAIDEIKGKEIVTDLQAYVGRVLKTNKLPGEYFTESDFFPADTAAGISAGFASGYRGFLVHTQQLAGLELVKQKMRVDVITAEPLTFPSNYEVPPEVAGQRHMVVAANDVEVIQLYEEPLRGVVSAVLAIPIAQAPQFESLLTSTRSLRVVPRSQSNVELMQAESSIDQIPNINPYANLRFIEQMVGSRRRTTVFRATAQP